MSYFDGIQGRDLVVWPRITDDGCELNIQLNAMMYDHERTIAGSVRYGVTGSPRPIEQGPRCRSSAQYIAEGAWNPEIRCQSFYERYLGRLYGPDALDAILKAFLLLEENEKTLGWHGRRGLFGTYHHGNRMGVAPEKRQLQGGEARGRSPRAGKGHPGRRRRRASSGTVARSIAARPWS